MSTDLGCLQDIYHALANIDQTLESLVAVKKAFVSPSAMERRRAMAESILKQLIWTTMTMRGEFEAPLETGWKGLAVAAWGLADEMTAAESPILGIGGAVPGEHEEWTVQQHPAYDAAASTPRAPSGRNEEEAHNAQSP